MADVRLVAVDLDGTLLDDNSEVSAENLSAIKKIEESGVLFVPCTGRALGEIPDLVKNNEDIRYIIYSNGAIILDKRTGKKVLNCIPKETCKEVYEIFSSYDLIYNIHCNENDYAPYGYMDEELIRYYNVPNGSRNAIQVYAIKLHDFDAWKDGIDNVEVFNAFFHDKKEFDECVQRLNKIDGLLVVCVEDYCLEIINSNAGKGNAVVTLSNMLGIDKASTVGIGDSGNDLPLMGGVGVRLAVSNAMPILKDVCDKVICSNNEHVADYVLNNVIAKK